MRCAGVQRYSATSLDATSPAQYIMRVTIPWYLHRSRMFLLMHTALQFQASISLCGRYIGQQICAVVPFFWLLAYPGHLLANTQSRSQHREVTRIYCIVIVVKNEINK